MKVFLDTFIVLLNFNRFLKSDFKRISRRFQEFQETLLLYNPSKFLKWLHSVAGGPACYGRGAAPPPPTSLASSKRALHFEIDFSCFTCDFSTSLKRASPFIVTDSIFVMVCSTSPDVPLRTLAFA